MSGDDIPEVITTIAERCDCSLTQVLFHMDEAGAAEVGAHSSYAASIDKSS